MSAKRSEVANTAKLVRDGKMSIVEGAWRLNSLRHEVVQKDFDDDFMLFVAIASKTDHLPVGKVRKQYAPEALLRADKEIEKVEKFYRAQVEAACEKLIARSGHAT